MSLSVVDMSAFRDELVKIAEINLTGLNPTLATNPPRPSPMNSPAAVKAFAVLDRMETSKTAATAEQVQERRSGIAHAIAGASAGRLASELSWSKSGIGTRRKTLGTLAGTAAGLYDWHRNKKKTATIIDPGSALRSSQKIGRFGRVATDKILKKTGPSLAKQTATIGRVGKLPTMGGAQ